MTIDLSVTKISSNLKGNSKISHKSKVDTDILFLVECFKMRREMLYGIRKEILKNWQISSSHIRKTIPLSKAFKKKNKAGCTAISRHKSPHC